MEHPEEIYKDFNGKELDDAERLWGEGANRRHVYDLGHEAGYAKCLADAADPLAGYSNLTAAIEDDKPIDWEKLDGLKVQCVHPELRGEIHGALKRNAEANAELSGGWRDRDMDEIYTSALWAGWHGKRGWSLWVEGEIPLRRKTADQLPLGTCFEGKYHNHHIRLAQVIADRHGNRLVTDHSEKSIGGYVEEEVEVVEEYGIGTFQKPEGK